MNAAQWKGVIAISASIGGESSDSDGKKQTIKEKRPDQTIEPGVQILPDRQALAPAGSITTWLLVTGRWPLCHQSTIALAIYIEE